MTVAMTTTMTIDDDDNKREIIMMTMMRISIIIKQRCLGVWENKVLVEKTDHL